MVTSLIRVAEPTRKQCCMSSCGTWGTGRMQDFGKCYGVEIWTNITDGIWLDFGVVSYPRCQSRLSIPSKHESTGASTHTKCHLKLQHGCRCELLSFHTHNGLNMSSKTGSQDMCLGQTTLIQPQHLINPQHPRYSCVGTRLP